MEDVELKKGVKTRILGAVLTFLGSLNLLLSWRGGLHLIETSTLFLFSGIILFIVGSIRNNR
ncbi:MAG: hypothetical protein OEV42_05300 [Deltaproteobacteria bacterium]|nr:hypothetical protein [Deltaproteobacteria bacterium]